MSTDSTRGDLVELIYDAALRPAAWEDVVKLVASSLGADAGLAYTPVISESPADFARDYIGWNVGSFEEASRVAAETGRVDAYREAGLAKKLVRPGAAGLGQYVCGDLEWDSNPWSELLYKQYDIRHFLGFLGRGVSEDAPLLHFSLFRRPSTRPFDEAELGRLQVLQPHLERASRMMLRLREERGLTDLAHGMIDALADAFLVTDENGKLLDANLRAETMLRQADCICIVNGRVRDSTRRPSSDSLLRAIKTAACGSGSDFLMHSKDNSTLMCAAVPMRLSTGRPGVLVSIGSAAPHGLQRRLCELYGLTVAEADVAIGMAEGLSVREIADKRLVSLVTVRAQLRTIFHKTGAANQAALVRIVLGFMRVSPPSR